MFLDDASRIQDMLDEAEVLRAITMGKTKSDLSSDVLLDRAAVRTIEVIGEAASHVSQKTRDEIDIPWGMIIGMRNRLIHGYADVNPDIVWSVVTRDAPAMVEKLRAHLDR